MESFWRLKAISHKILLLDIMARPIFYFSNTSEKFETRNIFYPTNGANTVSFLLVESPLIQKGSQIKFVKNKLVVIDLTCHKIFGFSHISTILSLISRTAYFVAILPS
jgi:hypothetical protein